MVHNGSLGGSSASPAGKNIQRQLEVYKTENTGYLKCQNQTYFYHLPLRFISVTFNYYWLLSCNIRPLASPVTCIIKCFPEDPGRHSLAQSNRLPFYYYSIWTPCITPQQVPNIYSMGKPSQPVINCPSERTTRRYHLPEPKCLRVFAPRQLRKLQRRAS